MGSAFIEIMIGYLIAVPSGSRGCNLSDGTEAKHFGYETHLIGR